MAHGGPASMAGNSIASNGPMGMMNPRSPGVQMGGAINSGEGFNATPVGGVAPPDPSAPASGGGLAEMFRNAQSMHGGSIQPPTSGGGLAEMFRNAQAKRSAAMPESPPGQPMMDQRQRGDLMQRPWMRGVGGRGGLF